MDHSYGQQTGDYNVDPAGSDASTAQIMNTHYSQSQVVDNSYVENGLHPVPEPDKISSSKTNGIEEEDLWDELGDVYTLVHTGIPSCTVGHRCGDLKNVAATKTTDPDTNGTSTTTAPATTTTWVQVVDWEYIGCYEDSSNRVFPDKYTQIDDQTNRLCAGVCSGYEYFGTEFRDQCYCSRTPPMTAAPAWNCNMHCNGSQTSEICGGFFLLSAWKKKV
ncbi:hypothetical protein CSIM01_06682 [Colletotrichum simmondsii]|uniref:WSC domain-containing protein n=1 Tax=Colletotrichum simmondsii TaxID=703756 RepID=A0A135SUY5_9PEZI|nr:hypothetical protein CSIM01_06682 [Colletotrichum simmondsii]